MEKTKQEEIRCSFCGKNTKDAGAVITTHSGATICAECLSQFKAKMDSDKRPE